MKISAAANIRISAIKDETGGMKMANLSELELQNLRHLIGGYDTTKCKMQDYASNTQDPELRQFFEQGAKGAEKNKEQLMQFLS